MELSELIGSPELLGQFGIHFKYFKIAENEFTAESLLQIQNLVSTIFLSEVHYDLDVLLDEIRELFKKEDRPAISLLFNWFKYLYQNKRITETDFEQLNQVYYDEGEVSMLIQSIREERRKLLLQIQEEREQGLLEGEQKGLLEGKREVAQAMLLKGLDVNLIVELTQLSLEEIEKLRN